MNVRARASSPPLLQRCGGHACPPGGCDRDRVARAGSGQAPATAPPVVHDVLRQSGEALPADVRARMESRLGHDFASVRVHTGTLADAATRSVVARAFTVGRHVVAGRGEWAPGTRRGDELVTHELTHVAQQHAAGDALPARLPVAADHDASEVEARRVAHRHGGTC